MILNGAIVNTVTVVLGSALGIVLKNRVKERILDTIMNGMGLCILYIGFSGSLKGHNILVAVASMAIGAFLGEMIDIDKRLRNLAMRLESKFKKSEHKESIAEGFLNSTMVICVGAMAIVGSLQSGLLGNHETLYAKSFIDFFVVMAMAAVMGVGVVFSAFAILIYEGSLSLFSAYLSNYLSAIVIDEISCVGSLIIIAIGLNILNLTKIKVANLSIAAIIPIFIYMFIK